TAHVELPFHRVGGLRECAGGQPEHAQAEPAGELGPALGAQLFQLTGLHHIEPRIASLASWLASPRPDPHAAGKRARERARERWRATDNLQMVAATGICRQAMPAGPRHAWLFARADSA